MTIADTAVRCTDTWQVLGAEHGHKTIGRDGTATLARGPDAAGGQDVCAGRACGGRGAADRVHVEGALLDEGGIDALRAMPTRGRPARLDDEQLQALGRALLQKPTEHGFGTELWTLPRVGVLI